MHSVGRPLGIEGFSVRWSREVAELRHSPALSGVQPLPRVRSPQVAHTLVRVYRRVINVQDLASLGVSQPGRGLTRCYSSPNFGVPPERFLRCKFRSLGYLLVESSQQPVSVSLALARLMRFRTTCLALVTICIRRSLNWDKRHPTRVGTRRRLSASSGKRSTKSIKASNTPTRIHRRMPRPRRMLRPRRRSLVYSPTSGYPACDPNLRVTGRRGGQHRARRAARPPLRSSGRPALRCLLENCPPPMIVAAKSSGGKP
jgi:hypothetical protein